MTTIYTDDYTEITFVEGSSPDLDAVNMNHMEGGIGTAIERIATLSSELSDVASAQSSDESDISALDTRLTTAEGDIDTLESSMSTVEGSITSLGSRLTDAEDDIETISRNTTTLADRADALETRVDRIEEDLAHIFIDGTKAGYQNAMKKWFYEHNADSCTDTELTDLCDEWYRITRTGWYGTTVFAQPEISSASEGTKGGDNAGLTCVPSTDSVHNSDDYEGLPLFAVTTVNFRVDDTTGKKVITAIKGITSGFEQDNPLKYVGVMQMNAYVAMTNEEDTYTAHYSDSPKDGLKPLPESVELDGTVHNFVLHAKYMSATVNGKMTSCSGLIPTGFNSYNTLVDLASENGANYSGGCVTDWSFLVWMTFIKYGSMTQDGVNQGCTAYNYQYNASIAETDVKRVILTSAQSNNLIVGSSVIIGTGASNIDRGDADARSISDGCRITSIEDVTIDGADYKAVYVDTDDSFDTTTSTVISTWHWSNGTNDTVKGNDGSIVSASTNKYPAMIQGIEYSVGGWEVYADVILNIADGYYEPYVVKNVAQHAKNASPSSTGYTASGLRSEQPETTAWIYISKLTHNGELFFGTETQNGSSTKYTKDGFYKAGTNERSETKQWMAYGALYIGSGVGGLSGLSGYAWLGSKPWNILARLSPNGNRGEYSET